MDTKRKIRITYEGGNGSFEYISNAPDLYVAIAVATKEMFKQCIWLHPAECRISNVEVSRADEPASSAEYEGTGDNSL
jgi:hypothetical protein